VIEFLHRVVNTFEDYFTECTETTLKDNYVIVYEVVIDRLMLFSVHIAVELLVRVLC